MPDWDRLVVHGAVAYASLIVFLRISGKRTLAKLNAFDLVVTVALGSTLSAVVSDATLRLADGVSALAILIALQYGVAWLSARSRAFRRLVKSSPTTLYAGGAFDARTMRAQRITRDEIEAAVRAAGYEAPHLVAAVVLESDGSLSVLEHGKRERPGA